MFRSPNLVTDADCLEQIQRLATRLVKGFRRLPYEERLRRLGLHSLHRRRLRGDLIVAYNVFSGGLDLDPSLFFFLPVRPGLRGHFFNILQGPCGRLRRKSAFSIRVVKYWNRLPQFFFSARPLNLAAMFFCAPAQKTQNRQYEQS